MSDLLRVKNDSIYTGITAVMVFCNRPQRGVEPWRRTRGSSRPTPAHLRAVFSVFSVVGSRAQSVGSGVCVLLYTLQTGSSEDGTAEAEKRR